MPKHNRFSPALCGLVAPILIVSCAVVPAAGPARAAAAPQRAAVASASAVPAHPFGSLPLRFELNAGQADGGARFVARTRDGLLAVTPTAALLRVRRPSPHHDRSSAAHPLAPEPQPAEDTSAIVRVATAGSNPLARVVGLEHLPGLTNYFLGNDPSTWRTNVPGFARVKVEDVYSGIDLVYYGSSGALEYDFDVAPGADPRQIALSVDGADSVAVDASGDLVLRTSAGEVRQRAPKIYQDVDGTRREVAGGYAIRNEREVGFDLAAYDATRPLVIDPQLVYSTYLGGSSIDGDIASLAVDAAGSAYVCGSTQSTDFPTEHPFQSVKHANETAFVTKLSADGSSLVYSTYLGGSLFDLGWGVAVNAAGEACVTGTTSSDDFPVKNAIQPHRAGHSMDAFVTKLAADGSSLVFSTFLGGTGNEQPAGIQLDPDSNAYVFGTTTSTDFPVKLAAQMTNGGGTEDGFVAIIVADGSTLVASTYFGGNGDDVIDALALDPQPHRFCVSGTTTSTDLSHTGSSDAPKARGSGSAGYFTAAVDNGLGGAFVIFMVFVKPIDYGGDSPYAQMFVKNILTNLFAGLANFGGSSHTKDAASPEQGAFVNTFDQNLHQAASGGIPIPSGQNFLGGLAVGPNGAIYAAGTTNSDQLPLTDPMQNRRAGGFDTYVVVFAPGSLAPVFSTYLGGGEDDFNWGIALDPQGNIYVVGSTSSTDFPTAGDPFQASAPPSENAFIAKISPVTFAPDFALSPDPPSITSSRGQKGQITVDITRSGGFTGNVTVKAPATAAIKVKVTPASASTTGDHVTFNYKVKKKAQPGSYDLTFTGKDDQNRERSATLTLVIQ